MQAHALLIRINSFLEALYGEPRLLSEILRDRGSSDEEIARLRRVNLDDYLSEFLRRYTMWMAEVLPERHRDILIRRYGLDGGEPPTLAFLGEEYGISRERIRQLQQKALKRLKGAKRRRALESIAVEVARSFTSVVSTEATDRDEQTVSG